MPIKRLVVTGDSFFLERYQHLFQSMRSHLEQLECLPSGSLKETSRFQKIKKRLPKFILKPSEKFFRKNHQKFIRESQETEKRIRQLGYSPDLVFHVFGLYSPFWNQFDIPYTMYLDYTMQLARKNWSPWAPFSGDKELDLWLDCEHKTYENAHHIFTMSNVVKSSLIRDYGLTPQKITVVGSSGHFKNHYEGEKNFGTQQIIFNGSDFERKGGDLVLMAFKKVKQAIPEAKLVIIGNKLTIRGDGIENPGHISSRNEMENVFLKTDLVIAPAHCDPFPGFLIEAMNYGIPCIVSDKDGMPEIVDNEVNGLVISQPTPDSLAESIIGLLSDKEKLIQMSGKAQSKVKNQLNWNNVANKIIEVLSRI